MLHYIINAALNHQCCIISKCCIISSTHYIINAMLHYQHCVQWSMLLPIVFATLNNWCCFSSSSLHYIINVALYHQQFIKSSMLNSFFKAALHHQRCIQRSMLYSTISLSMLHHTVNVELHHAIQNCRREFCATANSIKTKHLKFSEYFRRYRIRKNQFFRCCIVVAATLLHRRRFTDIFKT